MISPLRTCLLLVATCLSAHAQDWSSVTLTAEDAERPVLIHWQRTLADAEALSRETGRPLLLAVNVDTENASRVFALHKYRRADFAALVEPFVALIACPTRHTDADYDEAGRRIPCPRFGSVTCGEHVAAEPAIFEKYGNGERWAPRHIGVSPEGEKLFDRFLDQNLTNVDDALKKVSSRPSNKRLKGLLSSRDSADRERLEALYETLDLDGKKRVLGLSAGAPSLPTSLVRRGLMAEDPGLRDMAVLALATNANADSVDVLLAALDREDLQASRPALLRGLQRLTDESRAARRAFNVYSALAHPVDDLSGVEWRAAEVPGPTAPTTAELDVLWQTVDAAPEDAAARIALARGLLATAQAEMAAGGGSGFFAMDAENVASEARDAGANPAEAAAVLAQSHWLLGRTSEAAEAAAQAIPYLRANPGAADAPGVLESLARGRTNAIYAAEVAGQNWPSSWLAEAIAAYDALAAHPAGTAAHAGAYADLLGYLDLAAPQGEVLDAALVRYPNDPELHRRFRDHVVKQQGFEALEAAYAAWDVAPEDQAGFDWFAGYATLLVAEDHRRNDRPEAADAAYVRAIATFERSAEREESFRDSVDHYVALCTAGRARVAVEQKDVDTALPLIRTAIERRPASAESADGLEQTPLQTLDRVRSALRRAERDEELEALTRLRRTLRAEEPTEEPPTE